MARRTVDRPATESVGSGARRADQSAQQSVRKPLRVPARLRITAWLVLLLTVAMISVTVVTRNLLLDTLEEETTAALQQEVDEFTQFAREGRNPETGQPFATAAELLGVHLERQRTDESEVIAGVVGDDRPVIRGQADAVRAVSESGVLAAITDRPGGTGMATTAAGQLRWANVPIEPNAGIAGPPADGYFVVGYLITGEQAEIDEGIQTLVLVSLLGLALAAVASWLVAGQILEPVRLVRRAVVEIGEKNLTGRVPVHGHDDIASLSEQFNDMLDRLESAFASQRAFLDDASHELRTPITIVRGTLELISDDPAERTEEVRLCLDELDRMSRITEDLLLLAKAERPDFVQPVPIELAELTSDIDAKMRALASRRWRLDEIGDGTVHVDPQRVTQAIVQLAQNAVQHTGTDDVIALGSSRTNGRARLWVTDTGPGVPPEDHELIFRRFTRGVVRDGHGGAGLGLTIVRAIAEAHRGVITLDSTYGHGARFTIDLPVEGPGRRS